MSGLWGKWLSGHQELTLPRGGWHPDPDPTGPAHGRTFIPWSMWSIQRGLRLYKLISSLNSHQLVFYILVSSLNSRQLVFPGSLK